ncbi:GTP cyclohydrolase II [Herminiimonas sp. KBW02]|uniref:GTP cyclohydrolase II n=1 Tax=Herminiimonas sp. KBW02 TaxID=2153363 RepID=UPI000F5A3937|nr:GTP cyclohydrolase II [Herminiimonas sp. KBW02]RQO33061.1 GTP cyclohydrolase II [Herminiimonas sp. KBW02]
MNTSLTPNAAVEAAVSSEVELDYAASCELPTPWASFRLHAFVEPGTGKEHVAITLGDVTDGEPVLSRIHSECLTGDGLFSLRCDCGPQLEAALKRIAEEGRGALFYLRQEGRGIGLVNKIRAYQLQDAGADTVEANEALGFKPDQRNYKLCQPMLRHLKISALRLMTNNPRKIKAMEQLGVKVVERVPLVITRNPFNERYLTTKAAKLGHLF